MLNDLRYRLRAVLRRERVEAEMDDELRFHFEQEVEKRVRSGLSRDEAVRLARLDFGGHAQIQEECREARGVAALETAVRELGYTWRILRKTPWFTALAVLTLGLGICASTAIFSVVEAVLLRPLPFPNSERLVVIKEHVDQLGRDVDFPAPNVLTLERDTRAFAQIGGYCYPNTIELSGAGKPSEILFARLTASLLAALDTSPMLGRAYTQQEDDEGQSVVLISAALWRSRFQQDPGIIGRKIDLDRKPYAIIGVMPAEFAFPLLPGKLNQVQLWVPMSFTAHEKAAYGDNFDYAVVGRMKPRISLEQARQDTDRVVQQIQATYPPQYGIHLRGVVESMKRNTIDKAQPLLRVLSAAVMMVQLIACANLAGLLLVRALRRRREIAMRLALGARRSSLLRHTALESLLLSLSGCVLGTLMAAVSLRSFVNWLPETLPRLNEIGLNWSAVAFAVALALVTGLLCGLAPAVTAMRTPANCALKDGGQTGSVATGHARLRSALVIGEIAIALVLLTAAGLLFRSFERLNTVDPGFRPEQLVTGVVNLPEGQYTTREQIDGFHRELLARLQTLPGVRSAALGTAMPIADPTSRRAFVVEGFPADGPINLESHTYVVGDYLRAMGIPLLAGRYLNNDDTYTAPLVIVVNHTLVEHYWPGQDPIGRRMKWGTDADNSIPWMTVVGEVADTKQGSLEAPYIAQAYAPLSQRVSSFGAMATRFPVATVGRDFRFAVRSAIPPEQMQKSIEQAVWSLDRQLAVTHMQTMEQAMSDSEAPRRFNTAVFTTFALGAVLLAVLGIYGVTAFSVLQRTQEMAIRMALGAQRTNVLRLVLATGAKLAVAGSVIGFVIALAASRLIRSLLFGVSPFDPLAIAAAIGCVVLLALSASLLPAYRAASIDPIRALRAE
jgi:predicted permease